MGDNSQLVIIACKSRQMALFEGRFVIDSTEVVDALYRVPLVVIDSFKYLIVFVSNNFEWDMHIYDITSGTYQRVEIIKRVLNKTPLKVKK